MLSAEERKIKLIMELLKEDEKKDASNRSRDERGRFQSEHREEESLYESVRQIKIRKVKGSYGTYLVETRMFSDEDRMFLIIIGVVTVLAIIF